MLATLNDSTLQNVFNYYSNFIEIYFLLIKSEKYDNEESQL